MINRSPDLSMKHMRAVGQTSEEDIPSSPRELLIERVVGLSVFAINILDNGGRGY